MIAHGSDIHQITQHKLERPYNIMSWSQTREPTLISHGPKQSKRIKDKDLLTHPPLTIILDSKMLKTHGPQSY